MNKFSVFFMVLLSAAALADPKNPEEEAIISNLDFFSNLDVLTEDFEMLNNFNRPEEISLDNWKEDEKQ